MAGPASIGGITFPGIQRDLEVDIDRSIYWTPIAGGAPVGIPLWLTAGAERDIVRLTFTVWVDGATAAQFESALPPAAGSNPVTLVLPGDATVQPIPGFGVLAGNSWTFSNVTILTVPESLGRKNVGLDLYGYRFKCSFLARDNERTTTPTDTTVPAIVAHKFAAHQIQDPSEAFQPLPVASPVYARAQEGARMDSTIALDHLRHSEAEAVSRWFRAVRASKVTITAAAPFGPNQANTVSVILRELGFRRGPGLGWDAELGISLAV